MGRLEGVAMGRQTDLVLDACCRSIKNIFDFKLKFAPSTPVCIVEWVTYGGELIPNSLISN